MTDTTEKTRQQLCAALGISESTVRRLEAVGLLKKKSFVNYALNAIKPKV